MGDTGRDPLIESVTSAVVGVTDFGPHLDLFCGELGFEVAARGVVEAADAERLWGAGLGDVEAVLLTAAGASTGRVHLLKADGAAAPAEHPHTLDVGLAGLNLYTRDIEASHERLAGAGHPWISAPATYEVPLGGAVVSVTEGYCLGPDGLGLVFVQPANARGTQAWRTDPGRHYTELTSVVAHVPDFEAELAFWGPAGLGLSAWYDVTFSSPGIEEMAGLPAGTVLRLAFVAGAGSGSTRIELTRVESGHRGVDRRAAQRPARGLGHTGWSVRTGDADAAVRRARATGGRVVCPAFDTSTPLHGRARLAVVETPNGISVEIWQPFCRPKRRRSSRK
ncbi:VOC family protein [Actinocorallia populi]|uniref:VOC family protein n=1 Tax=Actinocorallia populi TaxID=2079200 RepID=UPI000D08C125|nr:VOC family protein [Actinocorallia populi]